MTRDLTCYGGDIEALANLVGDFDLRSPVDTRAWYGVQWEALADTLGFSQPFAAELAKQRNAQNWITAMREAGVAAFALSLRRGRVPITDNHATTQANVLEQLVAAGMTRGEVWRVMADPTALQTGACYDDESGGSARAFYPDTAPGYFGDGWPGPPPRADSKCGWQTPLVLHLGTFPWVYSSRLDPVGPGVRWWSPSLAPAVGAFRVMAAFLEPETNLRQDARQVVAIFRHFQAQTAPLLARVPMYRAGKPEVGQMYRRAGLLYVHQGSLVVAGLDGPRGRVPAAAYNHIIRRFACFFAVRRATVRALTTWAPEMKGYAANSADPCLRAQMEAPRAR